MVSEIVTKFSIVKKYGKNKRVYNSPRIYISNKLADDSSFPFKEGDKIKVRISGKKLITEKIKKSKKLKKPLTSKKS